MGIKVLIYTHTDGSSKSNTSPFALLLVGIPLGLSSMLLALQPDTCVGMNACRGVDLPGSLGQHVRRAVPLDGGYMLHCKSPALPGARLGFPVREDKRGSSLPGCDPTCWCFSHESIQLLGDLWLLTIWRPARYFMEILKTNSKISIICQEP